MCLATAYKESIKPENIAMENVMRIECKDDTVILTDIFARRISLRGTLLMADLDGGKAVIHEY